ncbi:hypothetical protein D3C80_908400 [compost metagenome]
MQKTEQQQCGTGDRVDPHRAIEVFQRDLLACLGLIVAGPLLQIALANQQPPQGHGNRFQAVQRFMRQSRQPQSDLCQAMQRTV